MKKQDSYNPQQELVTALNMIEKEKGISKEEVLDTIRKSIAAACAEQYGKKANVRVDIDSSTGQIKVYLCRMVVDVVEDPESQISLADAKAIDEKYIVGDTVQQEVQLKNLGRKRAQNAKQAVVQKIREGERKSLYEEYHAMERGLVTGVVQRISGKNIYVNLGKVDAVLREKEQVPGEVFMPTDRIKLYILEVAETPKGPRVTVSRTHKDLVKCLFEEEIDEVRDGTVEIHSIAREPGLRTKIAVSSNDPNVDPVGACVGRDGMRVSAIVNELCGEKIDIIRWSEDPVEFLENALSPAKVISVDVDQDERTASIVVPDYQLSLAIGKKGKNAKLAAGLTGYKIDIRSESQAAEEA